MSNKINKKALFQYLRWIFGDKDRRKEHAIHWEKILQLSPTAEIFDGAACGELVDSVVGMLDREIANYESKQDTISGADNPGSPRFRPESPQSPGC